eukprot:s1968_g10.t1
MFLTPSVIRCDQVNPIPRPLQALHGADCVLLAPQVPVSAGGDKDQYGGLTKAYRMPLPADVDEFKIPDFSVLLKLVHNRSADDALKFLKEKQSWKLKTKLGIYSPTPQYQPLQYIEDKPFWQSSKYVKRKMKKFYEQQYKKRLEQERFLFTHG